MDSFEEKLKRLEDISNNLENEKDLDIALKCYEEGIKLCKECKDYLNKTNENVLKVEK